MANEIKTIDEKRFEIQTRDGSTIKLTKDAVVKYVSNGVQLSDSEYNLFFQICKTYKLNPFIKEAYLVKYNENTPAQIVVDYKFYLQMAESNKNYDGFEDGVLVLKQDGTTEQRNGQYLLPGEKLIAGWCKVYRKDISHPTLKFAMLDEFAAKKKDGTLNNQWATKQTFMINKVAVAQALRAAFPNSFATNIYTKEEETTFNKNDKVEEFDFTNTNAVASQVDAVVASDVIDNDL